MAAQTEAAQTQANECRHVAILASVSFNTSYTARCFLPTRRTFSHTVSLFDLIPPEWRWVHDHQGSVSGQVLVQTNNSVYMISQKDCLDPGEARGHPYRSVYNFLGKNSPRSAVFGDFDRRHPSNNDAYEECMYNNAHWDSFQAWNSTVDVTGIMLPSEMVQMVRTAVGGHKGDGQRLTEYNFNYTKEELNRVFKSLVDYALTNKKGKRTEDVDIVSGVPIVIFDYPYETGLSIIGPKRNPTDGLVRDLGRDNSNLAWNRALQAKSALSNRQDPPPPLPSELKTGELVSITALTIVAIFLFERALKEAVRMRQKAILDWDNPTGHWTLLESETKSVPGRVGSFFGNIFDFGPRDMLLTVFECMFSCPAHVSLRGSRAGTLDILLALVTALVSMAAAVLEFHESAYRFQRILVVNSGGVITYGPSRPEFSRDKENTWAGAEFSVSHWIALNISEEGYRWVLPLVYLVCVLLLLYMFHVFFVYSMRREHDLDLWFMRKGLRLQKWFLLLCRKGLGHWFSGMAECFNCPELLRQISYETVFEAVFNKLSDSYGQDRLKPHDMQGVKKRGFFHVFERFGIKRFLQDRPIHEELGDLNPGFSFSNKNIGDVSRNEIEKCAEILAADRFGLLGRKQSLALMYNETASKAADRFVNENQLPDSNEIRQLALINYVENVIVPNGSGAAVRLHEVEFLNVHERSRVTVGEEPDSDHMLAPNNGLTICAVVGYRPRQGDAAEAAERMGETQTWDEERWHSGRVIFVSLPKDEPENSSESSES